MSSDRTSLLRLLNATAELKPFLRYSLGETPSPDWSYRPWEPLQVNPRLRWALQVIDELSAKGVCFPRRGRPMTPAQRRALEAVRDGRVSYFANAKWAAYGCVRADVADRLLSAGLVTHGPWLSSTECRVVLTDAGWEALERWG